MTVVRGHLPAMNITSAGAYNDKRQHEYNIEALLNQH